MNLLFFSECRGNALTETRRVLDQFAERRGERSWQTAITDLGLQTVHRLLRKTARKNTAVAAIWIRGKDHSELLWVVGDARRFNAQGGTPTNTSGRDLLRRRDENDWHRGEVIGLLAVLAGLWHDLGKANRAFQAKLSARGPVADPYRHEWVSLRLLEAFVGPNPTDDRDWLQRLAQGPETSGHEWIRRLCRDGLDAPAPVPLRRLPPLARAVGWLILSHHRLPAHPDYGAGLREMDLKAIEEYFHASWCGARAADPSGSVREQERARRDCWDLSSGLPVTSRHWREHVRRAVHAILQHPDLLGQSWLEDPYVLHLTRLSLMLADHYYSSQASSSRYGDAGFPLHANTRDGQLNQRLDEHLIGVAVNASRIARALPHLERQLARIARHRGFSRRSQDPAYRWQDRAYDLACAVRERAGRQGFFGIDMASTGCGKTLANGRVLYGLANPHQGARFTIALGLRSLTLQTGDAYRGRLHLGPEDMAVLVGGGAIRELHEHQVGISALESAGRESAADLLGAQEHVHYEGSLAEGPLRRWLEKSPQAQRLLDAPVLICTIDHLMPATEGIRGGHQIAPLLRLLSSDLVLDEPDDFDLGDLPALSRLVHWAGLFGSRVLLSSATLPPALVQGLFQAYREGRRIYQRHRGEPGQPLNPCCAWFDEFHVQASDCPMDADFAAAHRSFVDRRLTKLAAVPARRRALIWPLGIQPGQPREALCAALAGALGEPIAALHRAHGVADAETGRRVSMGLIRMAHIDPLVLTAQELCRLGAPEGCRLHLCVYHSQHPLLVRSRIEYLLDRLLQRARTRADAPDPLFGHPEMRAWLQAYPEPEQIFLVLATAVAEVGRDHDYDWAIVEPSSMRSIIQLAGRVRRHRREPYGIENIYLLETNLKHLESPAEPAYCRPGFESKDFWLEHHDLQRLLTPDQLARIDSTARIRAREPLEPRTNLADLEHECLSHLMLGETPGHQRRIDPVHLWWTTRAALSGELQRKQRFRDDPEGRQRYGLLPNEDGEIEFWRFERDAAPTPVPNLCSRLPLSPGPRVGFWGAPNYQAELEDLAEQLGIETQDCARKFGVLDLPEKGVDNGWWHHPALGFSRKR